MRNSPCGITVPFRANATINKFHILIDPDEWLLRDWSEHLARHSADVTDLYSYPTLRALLRPNLGGVLPASGGGASGTLKRLFPLVALFFKEQIISITKP